MPILQIEVPTKRIEAFCRKWKIRGFALFGSVLRVDFESDSDVDVLVTFDQEACWSLFDLASMRDELRTIFARDVDLRTRRGVDASRNPQRRAAILESAQVIHAT